MNDQPPATKARAGSAGPVIIVGAGPVGCTAALLLADHGMPVTMLERHAQPHPLPRAVHLDDEVARILGQIGISDSFLGRSRSCSGLRLLDAGHRVMAEFRRDHAIGVHGFPQANMFHQPDLEELLCARVEQHPLITLHRGVEVCGLVDVAGPLGSAPVQVRARLADGSDRTFTGSLVLGCDGANSTIRKLTGITMEDLGFTERWLVVDIRAEGGLDTWDGVEQICDPARAATFMHVTGNRYRWEFQLRDGEDEAALTSPQALGQLLEPWTARGDLAGLEMIRNVSYTFRARLASRFQDGLVFLLGDAAHLTPPFIGQGLAAGLRDAGNLAWKIAHVLTGQASAELLASYETERRPHARAMVRRAVRIGWAMTGGQDRAAAVRRVALAAAVRSSRACEAIVSTATPRLKTGALHHSPWQRRGRAAGGIRIGGLIPNPLIATGDGTPVRLDAVLRGRTAVLTARQPSAELVELCRRHRLLLVRVSGTARNQPGHANQPAHGSQPGHGNQSGYRDQPGSGNEPAPAPTGPSGAPAASGWLDIRLAGEHDFPVLRSLIANPGLTVLVRPDRVVAAVDSRSRLPRLPWSIPAAGAPGADRAIPSPSHLINSVP